MSVTTVPTSFIREIPALDRNQTVTVGYIHDSGYFLDVFEAGSERPLVQVGELSLDEVVKQTRGIANWANQKQLYWNLLAAPERLKALQDPHDPASKIILDLIGS